MEADSISRGFTASPSAPFSAKGRGRAVLFLAALFLCLFLGACSDISAFLSGKSAASYDDLAEARSALLKRDYVEAEKSFERYLRRNPEGSERWETWTSLLQIALTVRHDRAGAIELLEAMRIEYEKSPDRKREVELFLAEQYRLARKYDRAEALWSAVAGDVDASATEKAQAYRDLADIYLRRLEFEPAKESLGYCLAMDIPPALRGRCLYDLAEVHMATDDLPAAAAQLRALLALRDIPEDLRLLSVFMLADTLEQQGQNAEARTLFESLRVVYPNQMVVEKRISALDTKAKGQPKGKK